MDPLADLTRLSVRRRLPGGGHGDVVGHLLAQDEGSLTLLPDDRGPVTIRRTDLVASREVPPRAVRPSSAPADLARFLARHWPGTEQERLGGWVLRGGGGFTKRANSALAIGEPGLPVEEALRHVAAWYAARDLPARLQVLVGDDSAPPGRPVAGGDTAVLVGDVRRDVVVGDVPGDLDVTVTDTPGRDWFALWRGGASAGDLETSVLMAFPARYVLLTGSGRPVACARLAVERRWAHVSSLEVTPAARGRGLGRAAMTACLRAASEAHFLALEVEETNAAALHLYARMGLRERYRYRYLDLDAHEVGGTPRHIDHGGTPEGRPAAPSAHDGASR